MKTRNKFETKIARQLQRAKVTFKYETEKLAYVIAGHYIPDFIITTPTGKIYLETKGYFRPEHKRKMVAIKKQHPELDIRILFYSYRLAYEKWAMKHGFKYAFEKLPKEWLEGL